jgi:hypothetical protein
VLRPQYRQRALNCGTGGLSGFSGSGVVGLGLEDLKIFMVVECCGFLGDLEKVSLVVER